MSALHTPPRSVTIAAHRGASRRYPENSLAAIKEAINIAFENPNTNFFIELDVHKTADHFLVIMHDSDVSRTTQSQGRIEEMTLNQLQALKMRPLSEILPPNDHCPNRSTIPLFPVTDEDMRVPTLAEVMALVQHTNEHRIKPIGLALDIKSDNPSKNPVTVGTRSIASGISEVLDFFGLTGSSDALSPPSGSNRYIASLLNHIDALPPLLLFTSDGLAGKRNLEDIWQYTDQDTRQQLSNGHLNVATPTLLVNKQVNHPGKRLALEGLQHGKRFWAMGDTSMMPLISTAQPRNSQTDIAEAIEAGANFINSDYPDKAIRVLEKYKQQPPPIDQSSPRSFLQQEAMRGQNGCQGHGVTI